MNPVKNKILQKFTDSVSNWISNGMKRNQKGSILLPFVIVLPFMILIAGYSMELAVSGYRVGRGDQMQTHAQFTTDAGLDYALAQMSEDENWSGIAETELTNNGQTRTTYQITVANPDPDKKTLTSIGRTYRPASASTPDSTVKIIVDLRPVRSGEYSVITGQGGLTMSNSSKITGGDVLINGEVTMSNSAQIGLTTNPVNLDVANQICPIPANATYPRLCNLGENNNPISINNTARIYGTVRANHQTNGSGMSDPGLTASSGVAPASLPPYDRDTQKAAVSTTITGSAASCSGSQTRNWAANTKINGNVNVSNSCQVTVAGNVWITGNLSVSNSARLIMADSLGDTMPGIMIDGSSGATFTNASRIQSNASGTGAQIITYYSTASCSPDCVDVTGIDLNNSRAQTTISLSNSAEGAQSVFYARWTQLNLQNGGQIGAVVGQTINMSNSATITFGSQIPGSSTTQWVVDGYRRVFD